ncbi:MAG: hypothetical protein WHS87_07915 [Anaerolineales bacterium]
MGNEFRQAESEFWRQVHEGRARHRRQVTLHIFLPLTLGFLLVFGLLFLSIWGEGSRLSAVAALATIWLILPILCLQAVFLALLIAAVYGLARLLRALPGMAIEAHVRNYRFQRNLRRLADRAAEPILKWHEGLAKIKTSTDLRHVWKAWNSVGGWNERGSTYHYDFYDYDE